MSNSTNATLQNAFDLIENNKLEDARNIIEPLLETENSNPAVWWVYAHALQDPEEGRKAIDKVIQLDPTYPGASDLKSQMSTKAEPPKQEEVVADWDDLEITSPEDLSMPESLSGGRSPIRSLLIAIIVIVFVVAIFALLSGALGGDVSQPPTEVAGQSTTMPTADIQIVTNVSATEMSTEVATEIVTDLPTVEPTEIATDVPTEAPTEIVTDEPTEVISTVEPTSEPNDTSSYMTTLIDSLSAYEISEADIETRDTVLGTTLDVTICAVAGTASSSALNDVMGILVGLNSDTPEDIAAFAVTLFDCNNTQPIPRTIGVERSFVQAFSDDEIAIKDFQREWKPLP